MRPTPRPSVVMLPGTLCDGRLFARTARRLRSDLQVIRPSLHELDRGARVPDWTARLLTQLPEHFAVVGFSLGGLLALEMLRQAPQRLTGLALIASNAEAGSRGGRRRSSRLWRQWRTTGATAVARGLKPQYFHHERQRRHHARLVHSMAQATPAAAARAQFEWAAQRPPGLALLARSQVPLMVVSGARDGMCPRGLQRRIVQARPDACWIEVPRCGHFVPLEAPSELTRALQHWLLETGSKSRGVTP